ncbi:MAG TPA: alpha/beta fold hydrolase [Bdellovibrio sp.]|uniref:alpha/beta fold hydrolase n=1 Tax=Bdellovibrio sp. TaxID=28201 RepID=UPI002EE5C3DA
MMRFKAQRYFIAVNVLGMLLPFQSHAAPMCEDLFTVEISRERKELQVDWMNDISFIEGIQYRERFGQVASFYSKKWDTQIYHSSSGVPDANGQTPLVDPNAKAVFIFFHGSGTQKSSGGNFIANMNTLANLGYSSISFDMPFHAQGPRDTKFNDSRIFMEWVRSIVLEAKKSGKPVYLAGHSFGPDVALEYATRYPKDVDGVVGLSPAGFTKVLSKWYDEHTSKMNFGGNTAQNDAGGLWAGNMSHQFLWSKEKLADPTIVNPQLRIRILSGNREEYVPAPVGGPHGTPIGDNTYDIREPLHKIFRNAEVTIEPGVGHYLFEAVDKNGVNVVLRELLLGAGENPANIKRIIEDVRSENSRLHMPGQVAKKYAQDINFRAWADLTYGKGKLIKMTNQGLDALAQKIFDDYQVALKNREMEIYKKILNSKTEHPEFYEKYKAQIDRLNPKVSETTLFVPYMHMVLRQGSDS